MHLRQECKKYIELNRFYGRVYLTSLQQLFSKTLEKELILFVLENDSRILKDLDIILALTPNELFIQKNDANKIFEKIAEIYLVSEQELKQPSKQSNFTNGRTIKEDLLRIKSQYEKDQVNPNIKLQLKQNHLELSQESEECIILEQSGLIIDNNNDYQQYSMMDIGQEQYQNNNQNEQFYQSDENSSRHSNSDIVEINDSKYYS
ncbi:hypothetical protein OXYTRIMIC_604 [Oxytricha trifallax]|uniref:Uncharacterized protein n=1 Tax=Oxytricha trifallax TaxID=1172189 RepID=A0A073HZ57_9SPIT|nr:hypothetical protein OXYTRIMIC_604 [Oxytricha trifallax]